jgi:hypothetical protein
MLFDKVISSRKASTRMDEKDKSSQKMDEKGGSKQKGAAIIEEDLESSPEKLLKDKTPLSSKRDVRIMAASTADK